MTSWGSRGIDMACHLTDPFFISINLIAKIGENLILIDWKFSCVHDCPAFQSNTFIDLKLDDRLYIISFHRPASASSCIYSSWSMPHFYHSNPSYKYSKRMFELTFNREKYKYDIYSDGCKGVEASPYPSEASIYQRI